MLGLTIEFLLFVQILYDLFLKQIEPLSKFGVQMVNLLENSNCVIILIVLCESLGRKMAGGQGIEPWITGPEPVVLPLYYPPVNLQI